MGGQGVNGGGGAVVVGEVGGGGGVVGMEWSGGTAESKFPLARVTQKCRNPNFAFLACGPTIRGGGEGRGGGRGGKGGGLGVGVGRGSHRKKQCITRMGECLVFVAQAPSLNASQALCTNTYTQGRHFHPLKAC